MFPRSHTFYNKMHNLMSLSGLIHDNLHVHVWPPRAIGGDIIKCASFISFFRCAYFKQWSGVLVGTGVTHQNREGFYSISIQWLLCLLRRSPLWCKLAHRQRRLLEFTQSSGPFFCFFTERHLCPAALPPCWADSSCEWLLGPKWQAPEIGLDRVRGLLPRRWRRKNTQKQRKKRRN